MTRKLTRLSVSISLVLLSLTLTLCLLELVFRFFSDICDDSWLENYKLSAEYDALLGWKKLPGVKVVRHFKGHSVLECHNSKGIRGPEYSYEKDHNEYRILVLGDSFAHGYTVEFSEMFSEVLKRRLNSHRSNWNKRFQVINTGTGGWSTDQELLFFQNEGKKYTPDLTVLLFCSNDVWYNNQPEYWCGAKPVFRLQEGKLVLTNVPVPEANCAANQNESRPEESSFYDTIKGWLAKRSCLYYDVKTRIKNSYRLYHLAIKLHLATDPGECLVPMEWRIFRKNFTPEIRAAWEITEALIVKLCEEASSVGSRFVLFYIPGLDLSERQWEGFKRRYGASDKDWSPNRLSAELQRICSKHNIDFINPTESFKKKLEELRSRGEGINAGDGHWNRNGHELVGDILAKVISLKYLDLE